MRQIIYVSGLEWTGEYYQQVISVVLSAIRIVGFKLILQFSFTVTEVPLIRSKCYNHFHPFLRSYSYFGRVTNSLLENHADSFKIDFINKLSLYGGNMDSIITSKIFTVIIEIIEIKCWRSWILFKMYKLFSGECLRVPSFRFSCTLFTYYRVYLLKFIYNLTYNFALNICFCSSWVFINNLISFNC